MFGIRHTFFGEILILYLPKTHFIGQKWQQDFYIVTENSISNKSCLFYFFTFYS